MVPCKEPFKRGYTKEVPTISGVYWVDYYGYHPKGTTIFPMIDVLFPAMMFPMFPVSKEEE